ncbi:MAG TPA: hypothetical protein VN778_01800 [Verrucomicrobiae bacterium]|nr:hypothetical protein [Verrucomicrobiae bacterium]
MDHEDGRLIFSETEYFNVPELKPEMPEAETQVALAAVASRLGGVRDEIEAIGADARACYRGRRTELRGLQAAVSRTCLQLTHVLEPTLSSRALVEADSEQVQAQLLGELKPYLER